MDNIIPETSPQKQCVACLAYFPETNDFFVHKKGCRNGLDSYCKTCRHAYKAARYVKADRPIIPDGFKMCTDCSQVLPATLEYFHAGHNKDGLRTPCKPCISKKRAHPRATKCNKPGYKICSKCLKELPTTSEFFHKHPDTLDRFSPSCKQCYQTEYRKSHPIPVLVNDAPEGFKRCSICRENIPATLEYFHAYKAEKDGLQRICKVCRTKLRKRHRSGRLEEARAYERAIRRKNAEYYRRYTEANHEKIKARGRQNYWEKREHYLQYGKEYRKSHPEGRRARDRNRRARKRAVGGKHTQADIQLQYQRQKGRCYYCKNKIHLTINGKAGYHADHIVPLVREGSSDAPWNIVLTCRTCNLKKGKKLPHEWPEGGRLL